jgi:Domain of unknown function (DUF4145)
MSDTKAMQCGHCSKQAVYIERGKGTQYGAKVGDTDTETQELTTWQIWECSNCHKPTLEEVIETHQLEETIPTDNNSKATMVFGWYPTTAKRTVLYPGKTPLTNLPSTIEKAYRAALKVQDIEPNACAVLIGRTLEAVCNHEQVKRGVLADRLKLLAASERFPRTLSEMAEQLKQLRNLGAHADDDEITEEDVPIIIGFLEIILEYLYVAPAKIAAVQARLKKTP